MYKLLIIILSILAFLIGLQWLIAFLFITAILGLFNPFGSSDSKDDVSDWELDNNILNDGLDDWDIDSGDDDENS
ncbi:MAG: hypothetical protein Kow0065_08590 [Methylomicrobium sp.]